MITNPSIFERCSLPKQYSYYDNPTYWNTSMVYMDSCSNSAKTETCTMLKGANMARLTEQSEGMPGMSIYYKEMKPRREKEIIASEERAVWTLICSLLEMQVRRGRSFLQYAWAQWALLSSLSKEQGMDAQTTPQLVKKNKLISTKPHSSKGCPLPLIHWWIWTLWNIS